MSSTIRLITFDLDDTLWDVRPALEAAEAAQWSYLKARFPSLALAATPGSRSQTSAVASSKRGRS